MGLNDNIKKNNHLYDPDVMSIITIVLGALGSIGGIIATIDFIERKYEKNNEFKLKEERKNLIEVKISYSFRDLSFSIYKIRQRLKLIDEICKISHGEQYSTQTSKYGSGSVVLSDFQFNLFKSEQSCIINEIAEIYKTVSIIEELIAENQYLVNNENYIKNKDLHNTLKHEIKTINNLMEAFGRITIEDFLDRTIKLCQNIGQICGSVENERNLKR